MNIKLVEIKKSYLKITDIWIGKAGEPYLILKSKSYKSYESFLSDMMIESYQITYHEGNDIVSFWRHFK